MVDGESQEAPGFVSLFVVPDLGCCDDMFQQIMKLVAIARPRGRVVFVRGHDHGKAQLRDDIEHLPAVAPGVTHVVAADRAQEPAIAVAVAGEA